MQFLKKADMTTDLQLLALSPTSTPPNAIDCVVESQRSPNFALRSTVDLSPYRAGESCSSNEQDQAFIRTRLSSPSQRAVVEYRPQPVTPVSSLPRQAEDSWSRSSTPRVKRKARKPKKPQKSALCWDPNFRGVTLWFSTLMKGDKTQLRISSFFSKKTGRKRKFSVNKCRRRSDSVSECKSSSEEDSREGFPTVNYGAKTCASCGARRTPLWRDAEDGTPLCNACGIRYRKYRVRCSKCWNIPKKDSKTYPACSVCGGLLRFHQNRKLW